MADRPFIINGRWLTFAPHVLTYACDYAMDAYDDAWFDRLGVIWPAALRHAAIKRKAEYLAGRHVAQMALKELGWAGYHIATANDRSPVWPDGVVGTITHTAQHAVCSVARRAAVRAVGIDAELFMSHELGTQVRSILVSDAETAYLQSLPMAFEQALTIVFSAKESLYKALYPEVKAFFDFTAAEVLHLDGERCAFSLRLQLDLGDRWGMGAVVEGGYRLHDGHVLTYMVIPAGA